MNIILFLSILPFPNILFEIEEQNITYIRIFSIYFSWIPVNSSQNPLEFLEFPKIPGSQPESVKEWKVLLFVGSHGQVGHVHSCVGGCHPWVLLVDGQVVVDDGGVVVFPVPHCPAMWVFVVLKVAVDMACT